MKVKNMCFVVSGGDPSGRFRKQAPRSGVLICNTDDETVHIMRRGTVIYAQRGPRAGKKLVMELWELN